MPVCDPFKQDFRQYLIQDFYQNFDPLSGDNFFIGVGRPTQWVASDGTITDNYPPAGVDSVKNDTDFWRNCLAFKKVRKEDVSIVVKRYDWQPNQIYDAYRDDIDLYDDRIPARFYILVEESRVYKCIDNNYGVPSTVAPTHTDTQIRTLSDGYRWKYLYTIPESKRKFLVPTQGSNIGYMPVEFIEVLNENDERLSQYEVQNSAVDGSIDFVQLNQSLRGVVYSDRVVFYDSNNENQVFGTTAAGSTSVRIGGQKLVFQNDFYNNMSIRFENGQGSGQQRKISRYVNNGDSTATVFMTTPLNFGVSGGASPTNYSIVPTVTIEGDGIANTNPFHTYASAAEINVSFLGISGPITGNRLIDRFEFINNGKNYTYADVKVVAGLTFAPGVSSDMNLLARAVMSPPGGHGSNPVKELGASSIMIVSTFEKSEDSKLTTSNDFRQFVLIKNPLLKKKQVVLNLSTPGITGTFLVGAGVTQGFTGAYGNTGYDTAFGTVLSWKAGTPGQKGTSELILTNITGGNFEVGGILNGITAQNIFKVREKTLAGTEQRQLKRLKLTPFNNEFDGSGYDFTVNNYAIGYGNTAEGVDYSLANARIYKWQPEIGTNLVGDLYLEDPNGNFRLNEYVYEIPNYAVFPVSTAYGGLTVGIDGLYDSENTRIFSPVLGMSGPIGKIIEIGEDEIYSQSTYDQTTRLNMNYNGTVLFNSTSFVKDSIVSATGASGFVLDWAPATGSTSGILRIITTKGNFSTSNTILYTNSGINGAVVSSVISEPELKYRSGTILHSQNIRPVARSFESKEEIKLIIEF
jgi:hypothetical protein